jgi:LmbE family N-acetylglucosaminyl deacetylase
MKVVVLSPHLDDAVLSVGATINSLRRRGADVVVLTVFAGDPQHNSPASYWDAKRHPADKADAEKMRREEDAAAAAVLRVDTVHLPFDDFAYLTRRDPSEILEAMQPELEDADMVLTPGWPLVHTDHRYLSMLVLRSAYKGTIHFYEELPYGAQPVQVVKRALRGRRAPSVTHELGGELTWRAALTTAEDFAAKRAAVDCYTGELAALGRHAQISLLRDRLWRREMIGHSNGFVDPFLFRTKR